ncbi:MAG TPA: CvpA family protein [Micropepsaceae bacterium]|nr:CvpA family protein [Micropepsaceae bacterium]
MAHLSLTLVDYAAIGIILISALFAMFRGLVQETFAIVDWLIAGYASLRLSPLLLPHIRPYISAAWLQWVVVALGVFLVIFVPLSLATARLAQSVQKSHIGGVDRVLGFVFGAGRGLVIVSLAYLAFASLVPARNHPDMLVKSRLYPVIRDTSDVLRTVMPGFTGHKGSDTASSGPSRRRLHT